MGSQELNASQSENTQFHKSKQPETSTVRSFQDMKTVQQWAMDGHKTVIRPSELTRKTSVTTHVQNSRISPWTQERGWIISLLEILTSLAQWLLSSKNLQKTSVWGKTAWECEVESWLNWCRHAQVGQNWFHTGEGTARREKFSPHLNMIVQQQWTLSQGTILPYVMFRK